LLFSLKFCDFSELTHWHQGKTEKDQSPEYWIFFLEKTQNNEHPVLERKEIMCDEDCEQWAEKTRHKESLFTWWPIFIVRSVHVSCKSWPGKEYGSPSKKWEKHEWVIYCCYFQCYKIVFAVKIFESFLMYKSINLYDICK